MLSTVWLPRGRCQAAIQVVQFCFVICHPISGGYCGGGPPLPIPNREVKPACADGTAMQCGRVGGRLFSIRVPERVISFRDSCFIIIAYCNDWTSGLPDFCLPDFWTSGLPDFWTSGLLDFWTSGLLDFRTSGLPDFWTSGLLDFPSPPSPSLLPLLFFQESADSQLFLLPLHHYLIQVSYQAMMFNGMRHCATSVSRLHCRSGRRPPSPIKQLLWRNY